MFLIKEYKVHTLLALCFVVFCVTIVMEWPMLFGNSFYVTISSAFVSTTPSTESRSPERSEPPKAPDTPAGSPATPTASGPTPAPIAGACLANPNKFTTHEALRESLKSAAERFKNDAILELGQPFEVPPLSTLRIPRFEIVKLKGKDEREEGNCSNWSNDTVVTWVTCENWNIVESDFQRFPTRENDFKVIVIAPVLSNWNYRFESAKIEAWLNLPRLPPNQRYLVSNVFVHWYYESKTANENYHHYYNYRMGVITRKDVIMLGLDMVEFLTLDDYDANCAAAVNELRKNGVTFIGHTTHVDQMPIYPVKYWRRNCFRHVISFRGTCNSRSRGFLSRMFTNYTKSDAIAEFKTNFGNDFCDHLGHYVKRIQETPSYQTMLNESKFCLLPRGDRRWTHRLNDCLSYGIIPVFLTAGVSRPFELLIPWDKISIRLTEEDIERNTAEEFLDELRKIPDEVILEMQARIHKVYIEYFSSHDRRAAAMLHEALIYAERINQPFWSPSVDKYHYLLEPCNPEQEKRLKRNETPSCIAGKLNSCG